MKTIAHIAITLMVGALLGCSAPSATMSPGDRPDRGDRELRRGIYWYHQGCLRKATDHLRAAYEYYCLGDRQSGVARSLIGLANLHRQTGDPQQAMPYYDAAIITARRAADHTVTAQALTAKAAMLIDAGRTTAAEVLLDEAQRLSRQDGATMAMVLNHRAVILMKDRRHEEAARLLDQAENASTDEDGRARATIQFTRGRLMMQTGDDSRAMDLFEQALTLDRQSGFARGMADDLAAMADIHERQGRNEAAVDCLERSIRIDALVNNRTRVMTHLDRLAALAERTRTDIRVTVGFVDQWLEGGAVDVICR